MQISRNEFKNALRVSFSQQFEDVPRSESEIEYEFSDNFKKSMDKLILKQQKTTWKMTNTTPKRMAVLVAVIALLVAGTMSVSAIREPALKIIMEIFDTHIDMHFEGQTTSVIAEEYELTWLPEGFEMVDKSVSEVDVITTYRNNNGNEIQLWQTITQDTSAHSDNEQGEVKTIYVNDKEVLVNMGEKSSFATWLEDGYLMDIIYQGNIGEDTMIKMIKNISKCKKG